LFHQMFLVTSATYDRCKVAQALRYQHYVPVEYLADWMCIIEHGRHHDQDTDYPSQDSPPGHGLLQIPSLWCRNIPEIRGDICAVSCRAFSDEITEADVDCAKHIFEETQKVTGNGFTAWRIWKSSCRGRKLENYLAGCFQDQEEEYPHSIEFSGATKAPMKMTPERTVTTRRYKVRRYPRKGKTYRNQKTDVKPSVESIKVLECDNSYVRCEFPPSSPDQRHRCQFTNHQARRKRKSYRREDVIVATEAAVEAIKVYDCGDFYMRCDYRPSSELYPYSCQFTNSELSPY